VVVRDDVPLGSTITPEPRLLRVKLVGQVGVAEEGETVEQIIQRVPLARILLLLRVAAAAVVVRAGCCRPRVTFTTSSVLILTTAGSTRLETSSNAWERASAAPPTIGFPSFWILS